MGLLRFVRELVWKPDGEGSLAAFRNGDTDIGFQAASEHGSDDAGGDIVGPPVLGRLHGARSHSFPDLSSSQSFSDVDQRVEGSESPRRRRWGSRATGLAPSRMRGGLDLRRRNSFRELLPADETRSNKPTTKDRDADVISNYVNIIRLHRGSRAMVLRAQSVSTSQDVVLKVYSKANFTPFQQMATARETAVLKALHRHDGVVQLSHVMEDCGFVYLVFEPLGRPVLELFDSITAGAQRLEAVRAIAGSLLSTVSRLHARGIIHRDIKPEHVLCDGAGSWRLLDFAHCADLKEDWPHYREGTLPYMAPEVLDKPSAHEVFHEVLEKGMDERDLAGYGTGCDVWSLGVMLYELLVGQQPFVADTVPELQEVHAKAMSNLDAAGVPVFLSGRQLPPMVVDFLGHMLAADPAIRFSAAALLQHPWLAGGA